MMTFVLLLETISENDDFCTTGMLLVGTQQEDCKQKNQFRYHSNYMLNHHNPYFFLRYGLSNFSNFSVRGLKIIVRVILAVSFCSSIFLTAASLLAFFASSALT
mmetsp:Transcript_10422/g.23239  ORF Transcript_10422/g.23239 Transcript_10422/m.23239 type:complete len:104 (+) Transcript_10422:3-314(+)